MGVRGFFGRWRGDRGPGGQGIGCPVSLERGLGPRCVGCRRGVKGWDGLFFECSDVEVRRFSPPPRNNRVARVGASIEPSEGGRGDSHDNARWRSARLRVGRLPALRGAELVSALQRLGLEVIRVKGSHHFLPHSDGRVTVVPVHSGEDIGRGLLSKILRSARIERAGLLRHL